MQKYLAGLLSALMLSISAHAAQVTYDFTAMIGSISDYSLTRSGPFSPQSITLADGAVSVGDTLKGRISYDTSTALQVDPLGDGPTYTGTSPLSSVTLKFDASNVSYRSTQAQITLYDNNPYWNDAISLDTNDNSTQRSFLLWATTRGAVVNGSVIPSSLNAFDDQRLFFGADDYLALAYFTSMTQVSAVPEPSTSAMLLAGVGLVGWIARRRKTASK